MCMDVSCACMCVNASFVTEMKNNHQSEMKPFCLSSEGTQIGDKMQVELCYDARL